MKIRANGKDGVLDSATSKEALAETSDLIYIKLTTFSLTILIDNLGDAFDCIFDDCETEELIQHKPGDLSLNHTYQITGAYEESVFLEGITSTLSQMAPMRPTTLTSKPSTSIAPSMRPSEFQEKPTCSNSPDLCAQFGILDLQVTCIDKIIDDQQQVIIYEYLIEKWPGIMDFDVGDPCDKSREDHKSETQHGQCLTAGSK